MRGVRHVGKRESPCTKPDIKDRGSDNGKWQVRSMRLQ